MVNAPLKKHIKHSSPRLTQRQVMNQKADLSRLGIPMRALKARRVPRIVANISFELAERVAKHPEVNWSEVVRARVVEVCDAVEKREAKVKARAKRGVKR